MQNTAHLTKNTVSQMLCCLGSEQDGSISVLCVQTVDNVCSEILYQTRYFTQLVGRTRSSVSSV